MKKTLCMLLALLLAFGATALAEGGDLQAQLDAANARIAELEAEVEKYKPYYDKQIVAEYGEDGIIWRDDAMEQYQAAADTYAQYGLKIDDYAAEVKQDILTMLVRDAILDGKAAELGLSELDDATKADLEKEAVDTFETYVESYKSYFASEGTSDEDARAQTIEQLGNYGVTVEALTEQMVANYVDEQLYKAVTADVAVTDDDIQAAYGDMVKAAQEDFTDDRTYNNARGSGEPIAWNPEGYRAVKHVLIQFSDEQSSQYSELKRTLDSLNGELDALDDAEEAPAEEAPAESVDVEAIDAALQGKWVYPANGGSFTFAGGSVTMDADGSQLGGTYTINPDAQGVDIVLKASDADVNASLPFTFEGGALALSNNKGEALEKAAEEEAPVEEPAGEAEPEYATLDVGSKGEEVKNLQKYLIALGYLDGGADGVYGKGTAGGVKKFQAAEGLEQTGTADSETQARLFAKKLPEKPVIVAKPWKLIINSAGTPELYIRFRNDGDVTVDRVDFAVYCYDAYDDAIKAYGRYDWQDDYFDEKIRPGETSSSEWYWGLYGFDGTNRIKMAIYKYHTMDGKTVEIPYDDRQWVEFSR